MFPDNSDSFLICFDGNGNLEWERTWDGSNHDYAYGVAVDTSGSIYITGESLLGPYRYDAVLLKYSGSGNLQWQRAWNGSGSSEAHGVATDTLGNVYTTGSFVNSATTSVDALLLCFDSGGSLKWQRAWGGSDHERGYGNRNNPNEHISR